MKRTGHSSSKITLCPLTSFSRGRHSFPPENGVSGLLLFLPYKNRFPSSNVRNPELPFCPEKLAAKRPQNGGQSHDKPNMGKADNGDRLELHEPGRSEGADEPCV